MGKQIHLKKIEELFRKSPVVEFNSIKRIIKSKNKHSSYTKLLIHNLLDKEKIKKIGKGVYTIHEDISLAVFVFKPAYLGLQSSLSHFGVWEQETVPIILTTKKVRRGIRKVLGRNILIRNIDKKYFFGFEFVKEGDFYLPYSDVEKTFIDLIIFNSKLDRKILMKIKKIINEKKLNKYLERYPERFRNKIRRLLDL